MSRLKKKYSNGQSRGGTPGHATDTTCPEGRNPRDYGRVMIQFHGGDLALENYVKNGRKGYYKS